MSKPILYSGFGLLFLSLFGHPVSYAAATAYDLPFLNEHLHYDVKFNGLETASSQLECTAPDSEHILITWSLKSRSLYRMFFHVNNEYQTLVDVKTWLPDWVSKEVKQKNINQKMKTSYDRQNLTAVTDNGLQWPVTDHCMDLLSMLYNTRLQLIENVDSLNYIIDLESHIWQINGKVDDKVVYTFSPALPIVDRSWKTDLMTNRISRPTTILTVQFGPSPEYLPEQLLFDNGDSTVEMRLKK